MRKVSAVLKMINLIIFIAAGEYFTTQILITGKLQSVRNVNLSQIWIKLAGNAINALTYLLLEI